VARIRRFGRAEDDGVRDLGHAPTLACVRGL
jgi:hypothetical protein